MVVAVGFTLVEPLADAEVKVPGVMAMLVAPDAAQLSVLLVPELTLVGFAVKVEIIGTTLVPEGEVDELFEPQPTSPPQVSRITSAQRPHRREIDARKPF